MRVSTLDTALLALTIAASSGCGLRSAPERGEVWGQVTGSRGEPLANVEVAVAERSTRSDDGGFFRLSEVPAGAAVDVVARHADFATAHTRLSLQPNDRALVDLSLLPFKSLPIDATQGGVASDGQGFSLALPPFALTDSHGDPVHGEVQVRYALLDEPSEMLAAPGGMLAEIDGELRPLQSFGMLEVRFEQAGQPLTLAGAEATFSFPAHGEHEHGDSVGLYHFDEAIGVWKPRGAGKIVGDAFQASVDHFSWWNADEPLEDTGCISGRVLTPSGEPAARVLVHAVGLDLLTHLTAQTDESGAFTLRVPRGSRNALSAFWMDEVNGQTVAYRWSSPLEFALGGGCHDLGEVRVSGRAATCVQGTVRGFQGPRRATWWVHDEQGLTSAFGFAELVGGSDFCLDVPAGETLEVGGDVTCDITPVPLFDIAASCTGGGCQVLPLDCRSTGPSPDSCQCGTPLPGGGCAYGQEVCDGADNDCDGRVDEGLTTLITCGVGSCLNAGSTFCLAGVETRECSARDTGVTEDCNGRDDDCDGEVDEELVPRAGPACGVGACRAVSNEACVDGGWQSSACESLPPSASETCNALDDDCNGQVDEGLARRVSCGVGACNVQVSQACSVGNWRGDACPVPGDFDACDVVDNDCDGVVDEDQCCGGPPQDVTLTAQPGNPTILIIQDISGSIQPTWSAVRNAVIAATGPLDQQINFGLSVFPGTNSADFCAAGNVLVPPARGTGPALEAALRAINPFGNTPTASTLDAARAYLATVPGRRYVVLITDGEANCTETPGSPAPGLGTSAYAASLLAADGIPVYAIGWRMPGTTLNARQLNSIARAGGTGTATEVSTPEALESVLSDLANDTLICRFQLREPVQAGQLSVRLNGTEIDVLPESNVSARGWVLLDDGQTIELRGSACDERALGGVLRVDNSCGVCGELPCDSGQCSGDPVRDVRTDVATLACPSRTYRASTGSWAGTYRNTKIAAAPGGNYYVLGELIGGTASGIDDSGLGQPCFIEGLEADGRSRFRSLLPPRICSVGGIAVAPTGTIYVAYNDLETERSYVVRLLADGTPAATRELLGFRRAFDLVIMRASQSFPGLVFTVGAEARVSTPDDNGDVIAPGELGLLRFDRAGTGARGLIRLPNFRTINDLTVVDGTPSITFVAGATRDGAGGYGRGIVTAIPTTFVAPVFTRTYPAEVRAIAARGQNLYIAGDLDRSSAFGCRRVLHAGGRDVYAARISTTTGEVSWARQLGGPDSERLGAQGAGGGAVVLDDGDLVLVGRYNGTAQFAGARYGAGAGSMGAFAVRLQGADGALVAHSELFGENVGEPSPAAMSVDLGIDGSLLTAFYGGTVESASYACAP